MAALHAAASCVALACTPASLCPHRSSKPSASTLAGWRSADKQRKVGQFNRGSAGGGVRCAAADARGSRQQRSSESADEFLAHDYYRLLGVTVNTPPSEIRKAYWQLQKKHHPDIAGEEGHATALLLNAAYDTLMDARRRREYDAAGPGLAAGFTGRPRSAWRGPDWPQGMFVDEAACVGCQECFFHAPNTFTIDPETAKARVKVQWGDSEPQIKAATDACPVSCIHAVPKEDIAALEFLMQPRQRESNGVWGGGWERPERGNIFIAAQKFKRRMEEQRGEAAREAAAGSQETPAQRAAREQADRMNNGNPFWQLWNWGAPQGSPADPYSADEGQKFRKSERSGAKKVEFSFQRIFGRAGTSEILKYRVAAGEVPRVIAFVQEWASLWPSMSEIPLPMPFRADPLPEGVRLTLVTTSSGALTSIGALLITVRKDGTETETDDCVSAVELAALGGPPEGGEGGERWTLRVQREGAADCRAVPGEARIVRHLQDALARRDHARGYEAYHLPRRM